MPPIQVFSNSPINASRPSASTPQTAPQEETQKESAAAPPTDTSSQYQPRYPAPQPGAAPSLPQPTGWNTTTYQPTPTQPLSGNGSSGSPPPPQPGAVPVAPGAGPSSKSSHLPPPPKVGEKLSSQHQQPMATTTMPPQMAYSLSGSNVVPHHLGSSTSTAPPVQMQGYPGPASLMEGGVGSGYNNPLGYQQNVGQQHQQSSYSGNNDGGFGDQDESVWGTAKKWAYAAGDSLAKAEHEVWKKINKE